MCAWTMSIALLSSEWGSAGNELIEEDANGIKICTAVYWLVYAPRLLRRDIENISLAAPALEIASSAPSEAIEKSVTLVFRDRKSNQTL